MTRKDYELIAAAINEAAETVRRENNSGFIHTLGSAMDLTAVQIAKALAADNPRFDRAKFLQACGVQP